MPIQNVEDLFVAMLSHLHNVESRLLTGVQELSQVVQDKDIKQAVETRIFLTKQDINNIEECFRILGKQPVKPTSRFAEVWVEDLRRELSEIQPPVLKTLYALGALRQIHNLHIAEYTSLIIMADLMHNLPVMTLLERNLEDKVMFINRTDALIREIGKTVIAERLKKAA